MPENAKDQVVRAFRAVFSAFFGVNNRKNLDADATELNPLVVVFAAVVSVGAFITLLLLIVNLAVS
jgi:hypothetical protein